MQAKTLGKRLKHLRKINGETQKELAEKFGRHYRTVQNWEIGLAVPDIFTIIELAEYYNIGIEELINGGDGHDD